MAPVNPWRLEYPTTKAIYNRIATIANILAIGHRNAANSLGINVLIAANMVTKQETA